MVALNPSFAANINSDAIRQKAAAAIEAQLAEVGFVDATVEVRSQLGQWDNSIDAKPHENFVVTVTHPASKLQPEALKKALGNILQTNPTLAEQVGWLTSKEQAVQTQAVLQDLISKGADIPQAFTQWQGFVPSLADDSYRISDHAININDDFRDASVMNANISFAISAEQSKNQKAITEAVENNIKGRLKEIKETLATRIIKYQKITDATAQADIRSKVNALDIDVSHTKSRDLMGDEGESSRNETIAIKITPPANAAPELQALRDKLSKDANYALTADEKKIAENANVINLLETNEIGKALGRSILHAGATANEVFPIVAGRKDMITAIGKSLSRLKTAKPELAAEVDVVLKGDIFKSSWMRRDDKDAKKPAPSFTSTEKGDLNLSIQLDLNKPLAIISEIATTAPTNWVGNVRQPEAQPLIPRQTAAEIVAEGPTGVFDRIKSAIGLG